MIKKIILGSSILLFAIIFLIKFEKESSTSVHLVDNLIVANREEEFRKFEDLRLNYNDPFQNKVAESRKPIVRLAKPALSVQTPLDKTKEQIKWPDLKIIGEIRGKSTDHTIYIVRFDKLEFSLFEGDIFDTLRLKEVTSSEFTIQTQSGLQKTFQRTLFN